MNAYSEDLRLKALAALDRGMPRKEARSAPSASRLPPSNSWLKRRREEGEGLSPRPSPGKTPTILATAEERRALWRSSKRTTTPHLSATASFGRRIVA